MSDGGAGIYAWLARNYDAHLLLQWQMHMSYILSMLLFPRGRL